MKPTCYNCWMCLVGLLFFLSGTVCAQDDTKGSLTVNGYVKDLHTFSFTPGYQTLISGNLLHHRINFKYRKQGFSAGLELRNRLLWGESAGLITNPGNSLRNANEWKPVSVLWLNRGNLLLHTQVDRLWIEYQAGKLAVRAGRQRINWGIATTWNPNDLFNTYNFLDFDYEERPGSDALKVEYQTGGLSSLSIAASHGGDPAQQVIAARYFFNKFHYDIQLLGGWYRQRWTAGMGLAGNIGLAGLKAEMQYFHRTDTLPGQFLLTAGADYVFQNGWYISGSLLYNHLGLDKPGNTLSLQSINLSPDNPMPARWSFLVAAAVPVTPLFNTQFSVIYSPGMQLLMILPSLSYSLTTNMDIGLFHQAFFLDDGTAFRDFGHQYFLRLKYSY